MIWTLLRTLISTLNTHRLLALENLALRQQIAILQRGSRRPFFTDTDRLFWRFLSKIWRDWADSLATVKPETVIRWHRQGFKRYWTWKSCRKKRGRPLVAPEVRKLIRTMSQANPLWGAPRIHGELRKLGIKISQASVSKYMVRGGKPALSGMENFSGEPHRRTGLHRFPDRADPELPSVVCLRCLGSRATTSCPLQRHGLANGKMGLTSDPSGIPLGFCAQISSSGPGLHSYGQGFVRRVRSMGIKEVKIAPRSPWQNPYAERFVGTLRRDCLNHVIVLSENHLRRIVRKLSRLLSRLPNAPVSGQGCTRAESH